MIWAALVALIFGGGSPNMGMSTENYRDIKAEIMEVMEDIEKRQDVIKVLYGLKRKSGQYSKQHMKHLRSLMKDLKQYDSLDDVLDEQLAEVDGVRRGWYDEIIEVRFAMHDLMTREEWESVFGVQ
jgi:hypothetical protein